MNCPSCGSPATAQGQPSKRQFYGCGSYGYEPGKLADKTELCIAWAELNRAEASKSAEFEAHKMTKCERDALKVELQDWKAGSCAEAKAGDEARAKLAALTAERDALKAALQKRIAEDKL